MNINPFSIISRSKAYPFAELLRDDLYFKLIDTFFVLFGNLGLIDYLSLLLRLNLFDYATSLEDSNFAKLSQGSAESKFKS